MQITRVIRITVTGLIGIFGLFGTGLVSKFISKWGNELRNAEEDEDATKGRDIASTSDQVLNDQTHDLPKGE